MIKLVNRAVVLLVMFAITGVPALADTITEKVTFLRDVKVNGTVVKKGTYKAVFDDQTGELSIVKGKETVAKVPARIEKLRKLSRGSYSWRPDDNALLSVGFKDGNLAVVQYGGESGGERSQ